HLLASPPRDGHAPELRSQQKDSVPRSMFAPCRAAFCHRAQARMWKVRHTKSYLRIVETGFWLASTNHAPAHCRQRARPIPPPPAWRHKRSLALRTERLALRQTYRPRGKSHLENPSSLDG